ncbi:MAG: hypothetical protein J2P44_09530, partial [Candidatus Dormibacteraeota bacterium]|nr:hypothetical protein [Candidatus Dormibacteraeota bacterium]
MTTDPPHERPFRGGRAYVVSDVRTRPVFTGALASDAALLESFVGAGEAALGTNLDPEQSVAVREELRGARHTFLRP